jgi:hypothetical protein
MKRQKKIYHLYTALFLLLCFAAVQLPFELFHAHKNINACIPKNTANGICHHKTHIAKQEQFCWACIIQIEKTFDLFAYTFTKIKTSNCINSCIYAPLIYCSRHYTIALRGPPYLITTTA